ALGFIVDRARPDGIDVSPVRLFLRMLQRIAVALRRRSQEEARSIFLRQLERMKGSFGANLERGDAVGHVVDGPRGGGEMVDLVDAAEVEGTADVALDELES